MLITSLSSARVSRFFQLSVVWQGSFLWNGGNRKDGEVQLWRSLPKPKSLGGVLYWKIFSMRQPLFTVPQSGAILDVFF